MSVNGVIAALERLEGNSYRWDPGAVPGSLHRWLTDGKQGKVPDMVAGGMQCFGLSIRVAYNLGFLDWAAASKLYSDMLVEAGGGNFPAAWCPGGGTQLHFGSVCCIPLRKIMGGPSSFNRGDVVFFSTKNIKYLAHVAVATGNGTDMISFGHGAGLLPANMLVQTRDLDEILTAFGGLLTRCDFGTPNW